MADYARNPMEVYNIIFPLKTRLEVYWFDSLLLSNRIFNDFVSIDIIFYIFKINSGIF